jgi:hypothetical protein
MGAVVWLNNQGHALFEYDPALSRELISAIVMRKIDSFVTFFWHAKESNSSAGSKIDIKLSFAMRNLKF